jgi:hypothetical protein
MIETGSPHCKPTLVKLVVTGAGQQREAGGQLMMGHRVFRIAVEWRMDGRRVIGQITKPLWYGIFNWEGCAGKHRCCEASS